MGHFFVRTSLTADHRPPYLLWFSATTAAPHFFAHASTASSSRGLMVNMSITAALTPWASRALAACMASWTMMPAAKRAMSVPSRRVTALPMGSSLPSA